MKQIKTKCVFGPVPSRRLGLSLGIDLLPFKTCSMDCVYCECGATTRLTCERKEYFPTRDVIAEIDGVLSQQPKIDCITFSGVGEPTLHSGIGEIVRHIHNRYPDLRICLLTNSSLLGDSMLQEELEHISLIIPSLDGSCEEEFRKINRPAPAVTLQSVMEGLLAFRKRYPQMAMWLEIFIIPGINDSLESAERFRLLAEQIKPDKVQLNSLDRPGVVNWVQPEIPEILEQMAESIGRSVPVEIISRHRKQVMTKDGLPDVEQYNELILKTLQSRPCTAEDLVSTLGIPANRIEPHLRRMERAGLVMAEPGTRGMFWRHA
ncbi:MAG: radical SAM protein [Lentisphaeria bacterium]|nr:radical SAM protein [Lentisphaeria bacterium]